MKPKDNVPKLDAFEIGFALLPFLDNSNFRFIYLKEN